MKETKNYKLNLPQDTDYVDIEDFNSNFNNIDNIVKENNESVNNEIKNKVTELEKKIGSGSSGGSSSSGSGIDESKLNEIKQELDKKIQDFIDTKNKINGIAGLDEEGKVKKEHLPEILENTKIVTGSYLGDGTKKLINLGFTPKLIYICRNDIENIDGVGWLAINVNSHAKELVFSNKSTAPPTEVDITLDEMGFYVHRLFTNSHNQQYYYIAIG